MIGIKEIASYVPDERILNFDNCDHYGVTRDFVKNKIGVLKRHIAEENESCVDMALGAIKSLMSKVDTTIDDIECIVFVTQTPHAEGLPHSSAYLHGKLDLHSSVACFDVSLGCSGYVYGLNIICGFMNESKFKNGILVTSDPYSKIIDYNDKNTALLFGDAATATLISDKPRFVITDSVYSTDGTGLSSLIKSNGILKMNGREVFNFVAQNIPIQVKKLLKDANISIDQVDLFVFHQGSKFIVDTLVKRLGLDSSKVPIVLENTGNTVSSSIPLALEGYINSELDLILLSGFGVGLSWGTLIIKKYKV